MSIAKGVGLALGLAAALPAGAADFGVLESAEAIEPKAIKISTTPLLRDRSDNTDDDGAFGVAVGYGLPYGLDIEALVARYEQATHYGSDIEWNPWAIGNIAVSFSGGLHTLELDGSARAYGLDTTAIATWTPIYRLDLNLAVDASFEDVRGGGSTEPDPRFRINNEYETFYVAPGVEYALTRDVDLLAEIGIGLNGASEDYAGAGVAWYLSR